MNPKALTALKASIKYWEENVEKAKNGKLLSKDIQSDEGGLCTAFRKGRNCSGCPVRTFTEANGCIHTPWYSVHEDLDSERSAEENSKVMLEFLINLLPEGEHQCLKT